MQFLVSSLRLKRPCLFHIRDTTAVTAPVVLAGNGGSSQGEGMEAQATCDLFRPYTWRTLLDPWHFRRRPCPMLQSLVGFPTFPSANLRDLRDESLDCTSV